MLEEEAEAQGEERRGLSGIAPPEESLGSMDEAGRLGRRLSGRITGRVSGSRLGLSDP